MSFLDDLIEAAPQAGLAKKSKTTPLKTAYKVVLIGDAEACLGALMANELFGADVLVVARNNYIGGMLGGGINQSDVNSARSPGLLVGGARKYWTGLANAETTEHTLKQFWRSEGPMRPSQVRRQTDKVIAASRNTDILYGWHLVSITLDNVNLTTRVTVQNEAGRRQTYTCQRALDADMVGDIQKMVPLSYSVGRESTSLYTGETFAGTKAPGTWSPNVAIDPWTIPGDATSPPLYPLRTNPSTTVGAGDGLVMEFGWRLFFTSVAADKIAIPDPNLATYDAMKYELLGRAMVASPTYFGDATLGLGRLFQFYDLQRTGGTAMGPTFMKYVDINSIGPISTNYPNTDACREYVTTATHARRKEIEEDAWQGVLGLFYFLKTDVRVPATLLTALNNYGFSNKEWRDNAGKPKQFYVREGARVVGDFVMTQPMATVFANTALLTAAGAGASPLRIANLFYPLDSHNVQRYVVAGAPKIEGSQLFDLGSEAGAPIPINVLWPKYAESKVTLHPGNGSFSNVVWRSARVGMVLFQLGYAAFINAMLSIEDNCAVQDVDPTRMARYLDLDEAFRGLTGSPDGGTYTQATRTVVSKTGAWSQSADRFGFIGNYALVIALASTTPAYWRPRIYDAGWYQARVMYQPLSNRATNATYIIGTNGQLLANNPLTTTNASTTVTVAHTGHGLVSGAEVYIDGAATVGGIATTNLNGARTITVVDANSYTFVAGAAASSGATGGGAVVRAYPPRCIQKRYLNQQFPGGGGGTWEDLGEFYFEKGPSTSDPTSPDFVIIDPTGADGIVSDGGIQFIPVRK